MKPWRRSALLVAPFLLLVGGAWWLSGTRAERDAKPRSDLQLRWTAEGPLAFDLRVECISVGTAPGSGAQRALLEGVLVLRPQPIQRSAPGRGDAPGGVRCNAQLVQTRQVPSEPGVDLSRPFALVFAPDGVLGSFEFAEEVAPDLRGRHEELLRMFQFVLPAETAGEGSSWSTSETHTLGTYRARYEIQGERMRKRKLEYLPGSFGRMRVVHSQAEASLSDEFWLAQATLTESVELVLEGVVAMRFEVNGSLTRRPEGAPELPRPAVRESSADLADADGGDGVRSEARASEDLDWDERFESAWARLRASAGRDVGAYTALKAALRADRRLTARVHELLDDEQLADPLEATLVLALERVGHAEAQAALGRLADDLGGSATLRLRAVVALGGLDRPDAATVPVLWRIHQARQVSAELSDSAALALGSVGRRLREHDAPRYESLRGELDAALALARSDDERTALLLAMGNTTDPWFGDHLAWWMQAGSPLVRANAATALGCMTDPTQDQVAAQELLVAALPHEAESRVRAAMAGSLVRLGRADPRSIRVVSAELARESTPEAGYRMAAYLIENLEQFPAARPVLEDLLARTPSRRLRDLLIRAL